MTVTAETFRLQFPEFASSADYPDQLIALWLPVATQMVNAARWKELTDYGVSLWLAHRLALQGMATKAANSGKTPGSATGLVASKQVDKASISYDNTTAMEQNAGWYNLTNYGKEFWRQSRLMGAGAIQLQSEPTPNVSAAAWPGPLLGPF